jgi:hypothetical protein
MVELQGIVTGILVGVPTGVAAGWATLAVLGERVKQLEDDTDKLKNCIEGAKGLQVRVAILERRQR